MTTFDDERKMQPYMDKYYSRKGYIVDRSCACKMFDCTINKNGKSLKIEEKYLFSKEYNQMIVEILQDVAKPDLGWFYHVECDYLFWIHCNDDRASGPEVIYRISWSRFKDHVLESITSNKWSRFNVCTEHYGITINFPVLWNGLIDKGIATRALYQNGNTIVTPKKAEQITLFKNF